MWKTEFEDTSLPLDTDFSREDKFPLEILQSRVQFVNGHYQVLLLKRPGMTLPNDIKLDDMQHFSHSFSSLFLYCADFCSVFARADLLTVTVLYSLCLAQLTISGNYNKYRCLWKLWLSVIYLKFCQLLNYPPKSNFRVSFA